MLVLLGAVGWGRLLSRLPRPNLWLAAFSAGVVALALTRAAPVDSWIQVELFRHGIQASLELLPPGE